METEKKMRGIDMPNRGMVNQLVGRRMKGRPVGATKAMGAGSPATKTTTPKNPALAGLKHSGKAGIPGTRSTAGIGSQVGGVRNVLNTYSRVPIGGGGISALPQMPTAPQQRTGGNVGIAPQPMPILPGMGYNPYRMGGPQMGFPGFDLSSIWGQRGGRGGY